MKEGTKKYTIVIDLGEKSVVALAGFKNSQGQLHIDAIAVRQTKGLKAGRIENIEQVNEALSGVILDIENKLNVKIQQAYAGISGEYLRCERYGTSVEVMEPNSGVSTADVGAIHALMRNVTPPDVDTIMEYTPRNYVVDSNDEVSNPVGTFGRVLSSKFSFVLCEKEALKRLDLAFVRSGIKMKHCFSNALASAEAVLTDDERDAGVAVVDLGEGMTNVAIYSKNALRHLASIPIGGSAINADISTLKIRNDSIEALKCSCGTTIAERASDEMVEVVGRTLRDNRSVPMYNIVLVIQERMIDIIVFVIREILEYYFSNTLDYGLVITGGGANLADVDELFHQELVRQKMEHLDVRIGVPEEYLDEESLQLVASPEYATVVGLLRRGVEMDAKGIGESCVVEQLPDEEEELVEDVESSDEEVQDDKEVVQDDKDKDVVKDDGNKDDDVKDDGKKEDEIKDDAVKDDDGGKDDGDKSDGKRDKSVEPNKTKVFEADDDKSQESNIAVRFLKKVANAVNNLLTSPDGDQEL